MAHALMLRLQASDIDSEIKFMVELLSHFGSKHRNLLNGADGKRTKTS